MNKQSPVTSRQSAKTALILNKMTLLIAYRLDMNSDMLIVFPAVDWQLATGYWRLATGYWRLAI